MRRLFIVLTLAAALAGLTLAPSVAAEEPPATHMVSAAASWGASGATTPHDPGQSLSLWARSGTNQLDGWYASSSFTCDASSNTYRWVLGNADIDAPRTAFRIDGKGATFTADVVVVTSEYQGTGCAWPPVNLGTRTIIGSTTVRLSAGWTVVGDWENTKECKYTQTAGVVYPIRTRQAAPVTAWMTVGAPVGVSVGPDQLVWASLYRQWITDKAAKDQWDCEYWD